MPDQRLLAILLGTPDGEGIAQLWAVLFFRGHACMCLDRLSDSDGFDEFETGEVAMIEPAWPKQVDQQLHDVALGLCARNDGIRQAHLSSKLRIGVNSGGR